MIVTGGRHECPKAEEVASLSTKIDALQAAIEKLRQEICLNTQARIYQDGVEAGKKEGLAKLVSVSVAGVNVIARVVATGILLGVLIAAGNTVGAIDLVVKMFGK